MLVLQRRLGETIHIGHDITVTVLNVWNGRVILGIKAPKCVAVYRKELYERIQRGEPPPRVLRQKA